MPPIVEENEVIAGLQPDFYGQVHPVETPELLATSLQKFETTLATFDLGTKENLIKAQSKCPPQLLNDKFKLLFLRCEVFNVKVRICVREWAALYRGCKTREQRVKERAVVIFWYPVDSYRTFMWRVFMIGALNDCS